VAFFVTTFTCYILAPHSCFRNVRYYNMSDVPPQAKADKAKKKGKKSPGGIGSAVEVLKKSPKVQGLAVLVSAYFLTQKLFDFAWKAQLRVFYPSSVDYQVRLVGNGLYVQRALALWPSSTPSEPMMLAFAGGVERRCSADRRRYHCAHGDLQVCFPASWLEGWVLGRALTMLQACKLSRSGSY